MFRFSRSFTLGIALAMVSSASVRALAQEGSAENPADPNAVVPPKLVTFVKATIPDGAAPAEPVAVLTELTIDETGRVTNASVVESENPSLDAAVLDAVLAFVFEPAKRGGTPMSVTIRYRYVVEPPPPPPPAAVAAVPSVAAAPPAAKPAAPAATKAPAGDELEEFTATAEVDAPPREPVRRSIEGEALTRIPGTGGDPVKAIEVMPGVARTQGGDPLLRGSAWNESKTLLDGVPVPFLYHFGGLTSFMHPRLIERVDVYPGNFSTRYGRVTGGIVEVHARDPRTDALHGVLDLNLIDSSLLVEAPIGDKTAVAAAVRRSNIDFFFNAFVPEDAYSVVAAPVYWDYQAMLAHRFDSKNKLRVMVYGGHDSVDLLFSDPVDEDPAIQGEVGGMIQFHRLQASLRSQFSPTVSQDLVVALTAIDIEQRFGVLFQEIQGPEMTARGEWSFELLPELRLTAGLDFSAMWAGGSYYGPQPTQNEGAPRDNDPLATQRLIAVEDDDITQLRTGVYVDFGIRPVPSLLLVPGVRADVYAETDDATLDPRFTARYDVTQSTALKGAIGLYSQPPEYWQTLAVIGNPDLEPYRATQTSLGVEQRFGPLKLGVEGFYKWLENRVVSTPTGGPPRYVNDGEGRIVGGELSAEFNPEAGTFGYLGYTLSRSERRDLDGEWRPFDQDQTHILSLAAGHELGAGWNVGARFRYVTGNPTTPVVGSVYDARNGVYVPLYGAVNSERNPAFHQLDVRVEKRFRVGPGSIALYLDLQNAYNATNQEGIRYSYDYRQQEPISGLPILPNLGVRGEL
ncbi:MAG TPA: TonB-dependent receptor [Polyangiaceae bacterium]